MIQNNGIYIYIYKTNVSGFSGYRVFSALHSEVPSRERYIYIYCNFGPSKTSVNILALHVFRENREGLAEDEIEVEDQR